MFVKIHRDFQLEEYLIKLNGEVKLNLLHRESGYNYYLTLEFSNEGFFLIYKINLNYIHLLIN